MGPGRGPGPEPWAFIFSENCYFSQKQAFLKNGSLAARIAKPLAGTKTYNDYLIAMGSLKSDIFIDFYYHFSTFQ